MSFENVVSEAEENLRVIRQYMERSKRYSNFAGISGVFGGIISIIGAFTLRIFVLGQHGPDRTWGFVINWSLVIALALGVDYLLTRRRIHLIEKAVIVRLTRHMSQAAFPGLLFGMLISLAMIHDGKADLLYPYWMLAYGVAICCVALSASKEVALLGRSFLGLGALALVIQTFGSQHLRDSQFGLVMFMLSFGVVHIVYGLLVGNREGW